MLVSVGRAPLVEGIGLEAAGVTFDPAQGVETDGHRRTSVPHIYAAGDVAGYWQLAHTAFREGEIAAENATGHEAEMPESPAVPRPIYTDPEIAGCRPHRGAGRREVRRREHRGRPVPVGRERARRDDGRDGGLGEVDPRDDLRRARRRRDRRPARDRPHRGGVVALDAEATIETVADGMAPHPTLSEGSRKRVWSRSAARSTSRRAAGRQRVGYPASMKIYNRRNARRRLPHAQGDAARDREEAPQAPEWNEGRRVRRARPRLGRDPRRVLAIALKRRQERPRRIALESDARDRRRVRHRAGARSGHVSESHGGDDASLIRPALAGLVPYEPGKPVEEVQRELGLERVVKLASNEGPYGPFPAAQEAIARAALELNRYPDGGAWRLRNALAERHGVRFEKVTVCAGADAVVGYVCQATLDPGDEVVTGWPSFASYVLDPLKLGAVPVRVPLVDERIDLDALLAAITPRTKLVFIAAPEQSDRHHEPARRARRVLRAVPPHVLTVLDQAYFEYLEDPDYPDGIAEYFGGHRVLVLRTFSKIFGLAGLRVGYGVGPEDVITAIGKVRRAFDVTSVGQEAALASLDGGRRRATAAVANRQAMSLLADVLREHGLEPAGPAVANFLFVRVGDADGAERRAAPPRRDRAADAPRSARPTLSGSRPARRTRSPSSARRSRSPMSAVGAAR